MVPGRSIKKKRPGVWATLVIMTLVLGGPFLAKWLIIPYLSNRTLHKVLRYFKEEYKIEQNNEQNPLTRSTSQSFAQPRGSLR
ncbi:ANM_HP_G0242900.mRNA.1.CDS.1 [Saccharomyces cerevisiae]|nr:ANM_HP_G0242900.mRNA.1.CDS.1 [Saccharomyces cerevisiae]CAI7002509.1 ANM_HP_G0242900.mRNA.1.CDS.1 [Saccharomyces cerevisiae]